MPLTLCYESNFIGETTDQSSRILVVDDDEMIRNLISTKLRQGGYEVQSAMNGQHALDLIALRGLPQLAIVDINMPVLDGLGFCKAVQAFSDLPVIMVTGVNEPATIIQAIEQFAEDYIVKPFNVGELLARVQRVLRRFGASNFSPGALQVINEHLSINFAQQQAVVDEHTVALTPIETKLLYILLQHGGRVVSPAFLLKRLWPNEEMYEDTLRVHIHRLRHKLVIKSASDNKATSFILTERGEGYRFALKT